MILYLFYTNFGINLSPNFLRKSIEKILKPTPSSINACLIILPNIFMHIWIDKHLSMISSLLGKFLGGN